jgi:hypothetical protein
MSNALLLLAFAILSAELVVDPAFGLALCALGLVIATISCFIPRASA